MSRHLRVISWLLGVAGLAAIIWFFRPEDFLSSLQEVGALGVAGWLMTTFISRLMFAEVPTRLLRALGYRMSRWQVFSIGWLRTFSNQVLPLTGIAVYVQQIREKSGASWQDLAASSSQQAFIGIAALGCVGVAATLSNVRATADTTIPLLLLFSALCAAALSAALGVSWVIQKLPRTLLQRISAASESFDTLSSSRWLMLSLVSLHAAAIVLRGVRIWILFGTLGIVLEWQQALLIVALAEATVLVAVTPGGLGVREAIIIGGAALLGMPTQVAVAVSLIDRLFVVVLSGLMAAPTAVYLYRKPQRAADHE